MNSASICFCKFFFLSDCFFTEKHFLEKDWKLDTPLPRPDGPGQCLDRVSGETNVETPFVWILIKNADLNVKTLQFQI